MNGRRLPNEGMHHILFQRKGWNNSVIGYEIRNNKTFIVPLDKKLHASLHEIESLKNGIPLLGETALRRVYQDLHDEGAFSNQNIDPVEGINLLQMTMEHIPSRLLKEEDKQIAELAIRLLGEQIPIIQNSVNNRETLFNEYKKSRRKNCLNPGKNRHVNSRGWAR